MAPIGKKLTAVLPYALAFFVLFFITGVLINTAIVDLGNTATVFTAAGGTAIPMACGSLGFLCAVGPTLTQDAKDADTETTLIQKLDDFLTQFKENEKGMVGQGYDPKPRRHRGHRLGIEPAGLKRWRLSHKRSYDPGASRSLWKGPRGGHYSQGPRKRRYDPAPRRFGGFHGRVSGYATRVEKKFTQYGSYLGFFGALLYGMVQGNDHVHKWFGPNASYWAFVPNQASLMFRDPATYASKVLTNSLFSDNSAWKYPFWISLSTWITSHFLPESGKWGRIKRPLSKISFGALMASIIGVIFLPASDKNTMSTGLATQPTNAAPAVITPQSNIQLYG